MISRRSFLKSIAVSVGTVAVGVRLAHAMPRLTERYRWAQANHQYSYGINPDDPLDIVVLDEQKGEYIAPSELEERANARFVTDGAFVTHASKNDFPGVMGSVMHDEHAVEAASVVLMSQAMLMDRLLVNHKHVGRYGKSGIDDPIPIFSIPTHANTVIYP